MEGVVWGKRHKKELMDVKKKLDNLGECLIDER